MGAFELIEKQQFKVPINGELSDLTAHFFVCKVNGDEITLAFIDLHVM